jgi:hypothetical protein
MANLLGEKINNCRTRIACPLEEWKSEPNSNPVIHPGISRMIEKKNPKHSEKYKLSNLFPHCAVLEK